MAFISELDRMDSNPCDTTVSLCEKPKSKPQTVGQMTGESICDGCVMLIPSNASTLRIKINSVDKSYHSVYDLVASVFSGN